MPKSNPSENIFSGGDRNWRNVDRRNTTTKDS